MYTESLIPLTYMLCIIYTYNIIYIYTGSHSIAQSSWAQQLIERHIQEHGCWLLTPRAVRKCLYYRSSIHCLWWPLKLCLED